MIWLCLSLSLAVFIFVLSPFWIGQDGLLEESSVINDAKEIEEKRQHLLERFITDERAFKKGELTAFEWNKRKQFLESRYIDLSKRLDVLSPTALQ